MLLKDAFMEAFGNAMLMPMATEATFFAMAGFGGHPMFPAVLAAALGATLGQGVNFALGHGLLILKKREQIFVSERVYAKAAQLAQSWLLPLLLLTWVNFGGFLSLAAGFLNVPIKRALPAILLGQLGYYVLHGFG